MQAVTIQPCNFGELETDKYAYYAPNGDKNENGRVVFFRYAFVKSSISIDFSKSRGILKCLGNYKWYVMLVYAITYSKLPDRQLLKS